MKTDLDFNELFDGLTGCGKDFTLFSNHDRMLAAIRIESMGYNFLPFFFLTKF